MTDTPEWHRSENPWSILLYTLKQDVWRKGEPVMVNDLMIRIENAPGSNHDLGAIADKLLAALTAAQDRIKVLDEALRGMLEPFEEEPCHFDHHGYCQEHFLQTAEECCVAVARAALDTPDNT